MGTDRCLGASYFSIESGHICQLLRAWHGFISSQTDGRGYVAALCRLKEIVRKRGKKPVQDMLAKWLHTLKTEYCSDLILQKKTDGTEVWAA